MGQIYSYANEVLAWLGDSRGSLGASIGSFKQLLRFSPDSREPFSLALGDRNCIRQFCGLTYWTRRWIIQEVVVAENVVLQHGHTRIPLRSVEEWFKHFDKNTFAFESDYDRFWATTKKSGPALLCQHRLNARRKLQGPYTLPELMRRYRRFDCSEPRDKVYALFNLMGQTREHLRVDYNATLPEFFVELFYFINRFESRPMYDVIGVGVLLAEALDLRQGLMSLEMQARLDQKEDVEKLTVSFFIRGRIVRHLSSTAAEFVEASRQSVTGLLDLTQTMLRVENTCLVASTINIARSAGGSAHVVTRRELCGFVCRATNPDEALQRDSTAKEHGDLIGLASCRVKEGDQVWQFHDTKAAFIVREASDDSLSDGYMIVGRAYLIPLQNLVRLDHFPNTPKSREGLKSHQVRLDSASLLNLVYWAIPSTTE